MLYPKTFTSLHTDPYRAAKNEHNDCTVKAVAVALGWGYEKAHKLLERHGRRPRKGFAVAKYEEAIREQGARVTEVFTRYGRSQDTNLLGLKSVTIIKLEKELQRRFPGRVFLILTTRHRHVAAFDGKVVQDWSQGRRHRVARISEVVRPNTDPFHGGVIYHTAPPAPKPAPRTPRRRSKFDETHLIQEIQKYGGYFTLVTIMLRLNCDQKQARAAIDTLRRKGYKIRSCGRGTNTWILEN